MADVAGHHILARGGCHYSNAVSSAIDWKNKNNKKLLYCCKAIDGNILFYEHLFYSSAKDVPIMFDLH